MEHNDWSYDETLASGGGGVDRVDPNRWLRSTSFGRDRRARDEHARCAHAHVDSDPDAHAHPYVYPLANPHVGPYADRHPHPSSP